MRALALVGSALFLIAACGDDPAAQQTADVTASPFSEGSRDARAVVAFLNDPATDEARLKAAGLTGSTARTVAQRRNGADRAAGTDDDVLFVTLGDFDAVKGIGPKTIEKVAVYARGRAYGVERGLFHGVYFSEVHADRTLDLVNTGSIRELDETTSVDSRALAAIEAARPILTMAELASLSRVKASALRLLREHADRTLGPALCSHEERCEAGLYCTGGDTLGYCVATNVDGAGVECSAEGACGPDLVCANRREDFTGMCNPAWMRGEFVNEGSGSLPDGPEGGVGVSVQALGLATVPTDAVVRVVIDHPRPEDLRLTLENPSGTVVPVWESGVGAIPRAPEGIVVSVPGDETANGLWTLTVYDTLEGEQGTLSLFTLELTSRWD